MAELLGLAATCFLAATLLPFPSEAALLAYLHLRPGHAALAVALATFANTAGGMTSYLIGRLIPQRSPDARALAWVRRHGAPVRPPRALCGSRAPLLGSCHIYSRGESPLCSPFAPDNPATLRTSD